MLTDSDDAEMFDQSEEEDKDTANQVKKPASEPSEDDSARSEREGTPAPQSSRGKDASSHRDASHGPQTEIKGVLDEPTDK